MPPRAGMAAQDRAWQRQARLPALIGVALGALLTGFLLPALVDPQERVPMAAQGADHGGTSPDADAATAPEPGSSLPAGGTSGASDSLGAAGSGGVDATRTVEGGGRASAGGASVEVGVTATRVTLGALLFDTAGVGRTGLSAPGANAPEQRAFYEVFVAEANERGGVHGRTLDVRFATFDPARPDDDLRACLEVTEDAKAFAVLSAGGFSGDAVLCVTERHATPMIGGQGEAEEYYARSAGRLFTPEMSATRMARVMARRSHEQGRLRTATIGVLLSDGPESRLSAERGLLPELAALGYKVAHTSHLSDDISIAQSQIPVEIAAMRRAGVDHIVVTTHALLLATWFNQADGQGYRPLYILSDVSSASNDFTVQSAPPSLTAIAYTVMRQGEGRVGIAEQPAAAECHARYRRRTGQTIDRNSSGYEQMTAICGTIDLFVRAAAAAGPGLTRPSWTAAMRRLGSIVFPNMGGSVSFSDRKFDGADHVRTKNHDAACRCFKPADEFVPAG